ncbi:IS3 family transposase, partial [Aliivibrio salmonicida]
HGYSFKDADELIEKIEEYIEYYNTKRIKVKLKGLTPIEYRNQALQAA